MVRRESPTPIITLLTDFGTSDGYVGVVKGVIAGIAPEARVIDLSHEVPPQDINSAAFLLDESFRYFPEGTIHLVVVDPGVGSSRFGLALFSKGHFFVGPDNGVFTSVLDNADVHRLDEPEYWLEKVSDTFHGRDVFAPVAARLAKGYSLGVFGPEYENPVRLILPEPYEVDGEWRGKVVYIDRFGNLVTNFSQELIESITAEGCYVVVGGPGPKWPLCHAYSDVSVGENCALVGGFGRLELSVNQGNAAERFGIKVGETLSLRTCSRVD